MVSRESEVTERRQCSLIWMTTGAPRRECCLFSYLHFCFLHLSVYMLGIDWSVLTPKVPTFINYCLPGDRR